MRMICANRCKYNKNMRRMTCTDPCRCCAGTFSGEGYSMCYSSCQPGTHHSSVGDSKCFDCVAGKRAPPTPKAAKAQYWRDLLEAKLQYIQLTPWPSQKERKVSGDAGEADRLLTVLYYDSLEARKRKSKGEHGDESD